VAEKAPKETRWTARKKADAVVRLLRGESLDELSRELRVEGASPSRRIRIVSTRLPNSTCLCRVP
jgi:hypothetical protein